ncbi:MAG: nucleotidyl transferase AbiEii/AbiGii toxin family protein, partial [Caldilineaceae bacterium]|nr:nucleotidyl transferase AbiEii/AbiGii toxin family protein [Caldilineaceae bacterium]
GDKISLGGAFALLHYLDYRSTYDVDAWWQQATTPQERRQVIDVIQHVLGQFGQVRQRTWGDVVSIELGTAEKRKAFSFQIAAREGHLQAPVPAQWQDVLLDSLQDLLASKMMALVNRGAPRDFRDIYTVCQTELATPSECWQLWERRQEMTGNELELERASLAVLTHLARIEQQRPLANIPDMAQRAQAETVRNWFKQEFTNAGLV